MHPAAARARPPASRRGDAPAAVPRWRSADPAHSTMWCVSFLRFFWRTRCWMTQEGIRLKWIETLLGSSPRKVSRLAARVAFTCGAFAGACRRASARSLGVRSHARHRITCAHACIAATLCRDRQAPAGAVPSRAPVATCTQAKHVPCPTFGSNMSSMITRNAWSGCSFAYWSYLAEAAKQRRPRLIQSAHRWKWQSLQFRTPADTTVQPRYAA